MSSAARSRRRRALREGHSTMADERAEFESIKQALDGFDLEGATLTDQIRLAGVAVRLVRLAERLAGFDPLDVDTNTR